VLQEAELSARVPACCGRIVGKQEVTDNFGIGRNLPRTQKSRKSRACTVR
jgi:hypothetical protein